MNVSLLSGLAIAVALFWSVGVYNRLMRLRARGLEAFGSVEKHLSLYAEAVSAHLSAARGGAWEFDSLSPSWQRLQNALDGLAQALKDVARAPLAPVVLAGVGQAHANLLIQWDYLQHADPSGTALDISDDLLKQWDAISQKVAVARGGLNQILSKYNAAIAQYPAKIIAGWLGFKRVGVL
ncbi:MAG: hypothetical protein K9K38_16050 [Rhodoferax sp.]|nr:hypothetical protein [Rhodoferax sp.]MCF8210890.1 hypothetical protein [Rhodoferax sp.]